jgi:thiamine monophosphate synthase
VTAANATEGLRAGAHGVAVIREVMSAPDPRAAVERLLQACNSDGGSAKVR